MDQNLEQLCEEIISETKALILNYIDNKLEPQVLRDTVQGLLGKYVDVLRMIEGKQDYFNLDNPKVSDLLQRFTSAQSILDLTSLMVMENDAVEVGGF